jgi:hypothetical protein
MRIDLLETGNLSPNSTPKIKGSSVGREDCAKTDASGEYILNVSRRYADTQRVAGLRATSGPVGSPLKLIRYALIDSDSDGSAREYALSCRTCVSDP